MLKLLHPRLRMFLSSCLWGAVGCLAASGLIEMIRGRIGPPSSALIVGWIIGSGLAALLRPVPIEDHGSIAKFEVEPPQPGY